MSANAFWILSPHRPMSLQDRHDAHEEEAAERALQLAGRRRSSATSSGSPSVRPHLLAEEAVAHPVAGVDAELLALVALGLGELRVVVAQRQPAEHHVPGLVLHHVGVERLGRAGRSAWLRIRPKAASASPSMSTCMPR